MIESERIKALRGQAAELREAFRAQLEELRKDPDLVPEAKQRRIQDLYGTAVREMRNIQEAVAAERSEMLTRAEQEVFRPKVTLAMSIADRHALRTSYRDALGQARSLSDPNEALELLDLAARTGDELAGRALAAVAYGRGWRHVLAGFAEKFPGEESSVEVLLDNTVGTTERATALLADQMTLSPPDRPTEVPKWLDGKAAPDDADEPIPA